MGDPKERASVPAAAKAATDAPCGLTVLVIVC